MNIKPLIGISANYGDNNSKLAENYYKSVVAVGGVPVIIPVTDDLATIEAIVGRLDGILLSGGGDMHPRYYNEEPIPENGTPDELRDRYDVSLIKSAVEYQLPVLGICRGMQVINTVFGGSLYQDINVQYADKQPMCHSQNEERSVTTQTASVVADSLLYSIVNCNTLPINSIHHQAVKRIADGFRAVAFADDGICEAIESLYYPILGVQWHPEHLSEADAAGEHYDNPHRKIFGWLVDEAKIFSRAKRIHRSSYVIDSHCDTPMFFHYPQVNIVENDKLWVDPADFGEKDEQPLLYEIKVDARKMRQGRVDAVFMVAYIPQSTPADETYGKADRLLNKIITQAKGSGNRISIATSYAELCNNKRNGIPTVFLGIENGCALAGNLDNIDYFYRLGVRYITLCHNGDNLLCDSAMQSLDTHNGLSEFGRQVVLKMNAVGMMVDVSHVGEKSFWDTVALSTKPIIASHSCCKALRNHPRNLTDEQIRAIARSGGVVQICLYKHFLADTDVATVADAVRHIKHVVELVGVDYVGIGSDFDGGGEIAGATSENQLINITKALIKEGFDDDEISKILGGNLLRVFRSITE
jgi:glutamine amidotransferase, class II/dipeptidase